MARKCRWTRQWTAEENRHGDLMNKYCYLSGRVNMKVGFQGLYGIDNSKEILNIKQCINTGCALAH